MEWIGNLCRHQLYEHRFAVIIKVFTMISAQRVISLNCSHFCRRQTERCESESINGGQCKAGGGDKQYLTFCNEKEFFDQDKADSMQLLFGIRKKTYSGNLQFMIRNKLQFGPVLETH